MKTLIDPRHGSTDLHVAGSDTRADDGGDDDVDDYDEQDLVAAKMKLSCRNDGDEEQDNELSRTTMNELS